MYGFNNEILDIVVCGRPSSNIESMKMHMDQDRVYWAIYDLDDRIVLITYDPDKANNNEKLKLISEKYNFINKLSVKTMYDVSTIKEVVCRNMDDLNIEFIT